MPTEVVSDQLVSKVETLSEPVYKTIKIQPVGGNSYTFSSSTAEKEFSLTNTVYNLARSRLEFDLLVPAQGAGNFSHNHLKVPIREITLRTSGDFELAKISDVDVFSKTVSFLAMKSSQYLQTESIQAGATVAAAPGMYTGPNPCNVPSNTAMAALTPHGQYIKSDGTPSGVAYTNAAGVAGPNASQNLISSGDNAAVGIHFSIPLSMFAFTIMAQDKNRYFNDMLRLVVTFAPQTSLGAIATSVTAPQTGAADYATPPVLSNLGLYLAEERDQHNVQMAKSQFAKGGRSIVPFVMTKRVALGTATNFSVSHDLNLGSGQALLAAVNVPILSANQGRRAANTSNVNAETIINVQTHLDSQPIQNEKVDTASGADYQFLKKYLNSTALDGRRQFSTHWCWVDAFAASGKSAGEWNELYSLESGLALDEAHKYTIDLEKTALDMSLIQYLVVQRELAFRDGQPMWV